MDQELTSYSHDLKKDIKARHDSEKYYGVDKWVAGHRNGATGLQHPYTDDINSRSSVFASDGRTG